jgi:hypothetical protein
MKADLLHLRYDEGADVLYVMTPRYGPAYGEEDGPGLVWRYLNTDNSLVGLTIMDYESYWRPRIGELAKVMSERFHLTTNVAREALQRIDHRRRA